MSLDPQLDNPLRRALEARASQPLEGMVYVEGGFVSRVSTVPTDGGIEAVVRFADMCWQKNIALQRRLMEIEYGQEGPTDAQE